MIVLKRAMVLTTERPNTRQFRRLVQVFRKHFDSTLMLKEDALNVSDSRHIYVLRH
jgi:hypothetical protein